MVRNLWCMKVNGEAVREIRKARGRTMRDVAEGAGIDWGYLSKIENGRKGASSETIDRLAKTLDVTVGAISYPAPQASAATIRRIVRILGSSAEDLDVEAVSVL
jgi:transcriptional regulator with XRE-family HTH domain